MVSVARFASSLEKMASDRPWKPYALAMASVFTALLAREVLVAKIGINLFAVLFLPAVVVTGLACGLIPGLFAAVLATFVPLIHLVGDSRLYFPSNANMMMNLIVILALNIGLAIVAASHRTYRKRVELAMGELNHRTKNLMTVVASVANRIAQSSADMESFKVAFNDRLRAMIIVNDLLVKHQWSEMRLDSAVRTAIAPFSSNHKIVVQGPELMVSPNIVENIMMALHELLTNSAKYGSLATDLGKIRISWHVQGNRLHFCWNGTGLHDNGPVSRKGFGTLMLTEVVPRNLSAQAEYEIKEGHVVWSLDIPFATNLRPDAPIGGPVVQMG